jgi:hypothetical protein
MDPSPGTLGTRNGINPFWLGTRSAKTSLIKSSRSHTPTYLPHRNRPVNVRLKDRGIVLPRVECVRSRMGFNILRNPPGAMESGACDPVLSNLQR